MLVFVRIGGEGREELQTGGRMQKHGGGGAGVKWGASTMGELEEERQQNMRINRQVGSTGA